MRYNWSFFPLQNAISQSFEGLMETFLKTCQSNGVSDVIGKKILYFGSGGAAVNSGLKMGWLQKCARILEIISTLFGA